MRVTAATVGADPQHAVVGHSICAKIFSSIAESGVLSVTELAIADAQSSARLLVVSLKLINPAMATSIKVITPAFFMTLMTMNKVMKKIKSQSIPR